MIKGLIERLRGKVKSIEEKKDDRCTRIAKRKYDAWPSAYASGAVRILYSHPDYHLFL